MTSTAMSTAPVPPAVIATIGETVQDYLHPYFEYLGGLPYELTEVILAELHNEGWAIVRGNPRPETAA